MALTYGYVKCKVVSNAALQRSRHKNEIQYHLHVKLQLGDGEEPWDTAINVGTSDADDLLRYKLAYDFQHQIIQTLKSVDPGFSDLTGAEALPGLDFLRSDLLQGTGKWRDSDVMDGSEEAEPVKSLKRLLDRAHSSGADVYIFGRAYKEGGGIHDVHMNQGSGSDSFLNNGRDDHNDHNDVWQDGAVLVDLGEPEWAAYFTAFTQQMVPTDDLGNPADGSHEISDSDTGTMASS